MEDIPTTFDVLSAVLELESEGRCLDVSWKFRHKGKEYRIILEKTNGE